MASYDFIKHIAAEIADDDSAVLVVRNAQLGKHNKLYCPNCGQPARLGVRGTGVVEIVCRSSHCTDRKQVSTTHETVIVYRVPTAARG